MSTTPGYNIHTDVKFGIVHRTRASERTVVLMVEPATVTPTGDA